MTFGDGMVKGLNGWDMSQKARNCNFCLRSFSGAKVESTNDYVLRETQITLSFIFGLMMLLIMASHPK